MTQEKTPVTAGEMTGTPDAKWRPPMRAAVSACVVLYHSGNQAEATIECLLSSTLPIDVRMVDNSPEDMIGRGIKLNHETLVDWIVPDKNVGYGAGNNIALRKVHSKYHIICNPDVTFAPDLVKKMVEFMETHKDVVILTPRVLNPDGTEQLLPRREPRLRYLAARRLPRLRFLPFLNKRLDKLCDDYTMANADGEIYSVDYATGCFMLARTHALYRLNGFDEQFFLYHEDSDLSRRACKQGEIVYHRGFCVTHAWQRDSAHSGRALRQHLLSTVKYFHKWGWKW